MLLGLLSETFRFLFFSLFWIFCSMSVKPDRDNRLLSFQISTEILKFWQRCKNYVFMCPMPPLLKLAVFLPLLASKGALGTFSYSVGAEKHTGEHSQALACWLNPPTPTPPSSKCMSGSPNKWQLYVAPRIAEQGRLHPLYALARLLLPPCRVSAALISQSLADDHTELWQVEHRGKH